MTTMQPTTIEQGQRWTFVHPDDGRRVDYIIEYAEANPAPQAICKIVNVETGGVGWVTKHWLRRPAGFVSGHFEYAGESVGSLAA